ncbi:zinc-ribbon domain-containing protein [Thermococcus thermotolerans]|uniref:zinc-ribbon domain-containing protein n=1 Tax=Thermococcus thermotolerans TaxID=2969672 RepID=UPI0021588E2B|nr:zinc-ribbon domain-containing protein [Thermococcus thermotolerans]
MRIKCPNCGAEFKAEGGIVTCPYCGFQIRLGEARTFTYDLKIEDPWRPLTSFIRLQRLSPNDIEWKARLIERKLLYVPFYIFFVRAEGVAHTGTFSSEGAGHVEFFNYITVPAVEGFDELVNYPLPTKGRRYFDGRVKGELIEKTLDEDDAQKKLRDEVRNLLKKEARRYFHWGSVEMGMPTFEVQLDGLVYYPMWRVKYKYGLLTHRAYVDGTDGRIPYAEFPIALPKRFVNFTLGSLLLASGFFLGKLLLPYGFTSVVGSMGAAAAASFPSLKRAFTLRGRASEHRLLAEMAADYAPEEEAFGAIRRFWKAHM